MRRHVIASFFPLALALVLTTGTSATTVKRRAVRIPSSGVPAAVADTYSAERGTILTVNVASGVLANDHDPLDKPLTALLVTNTTHGVLTLSADGGFSYAHDGTTATSDTFTYRASNGTQQSDPATVTINIVDNTPPAPVANNDSYSDTQNTTLTRTAPGVLANDTLSSGAIFSYGASTGNEQKSIGSTTPTAQGGSISIFANGAFTYVPATNFAGSDTFSYVIKNESGADTAQVTITVTAQPPAAANDSFNTSTGVTLNVAASGVLSNDTLRGATLISYGASTGSEQSAIGANTPTAHGGTVHVNADGSLQYVPPASFSGSDTFKYVIGNAGGTSKATVTITVQGAAADFTVTSPGFFYSFSGVAGQNPVITLHRGQTYTFAINTSSIHPFEIQGAPPGSVTNNNIHSGTITFVVPAAAVNYHYHCSVHDFGNAINTIP